MIGDCLRSLLQQNGFEVSYCSDGQSALALSQKIRFSVIVTDYQMPGLDGLEITRLMRTRFPGSFIVGLSSTQKEQEFLSAGADAFFKKPFVFRELVALMKKREKKNGKEFPSEPNSDRNGG